MRAANQRLLSREVSGEAYIPYVAHVDPFTIKTRTGDYLQVFRLEGLAHETAHDEELDAWHEQLCIALRNIASRNVALWTHIVRRETSAEIEGEFPSGFAHDFHERYSDRIQARRLFVNELYVTLLYRPEPNALARGINRTGPVASIDARRQQNTAALAHITMLGRELQRMLHRYGPERLGRYWLDGRTRTVHHDPGADAESSSHVPQHAQCFSEALEFLAFLINGTWQRMPLRRADVSSYLQTAAIFTGNETIEIRNPEASTFVAMLAFGEYPDPSYPGILNELLRAPFEFVLSQSFAFVDKAASRGALRRQFNRLESTEDDARTETEALESAIDGIASNHHIFGVHQVALAVRAPDPKTLVNVIADARQALSDAGAVTRRENLGCEAAFWSQLPGNFTSRTRPSEITQRNFAGFSAFHNYPSGRASGNHWGPALAVLKTASGAPFFFNLHRRDVGHFTVYGSTGSGKTVLVSFIVTMLRKFQAATVFFDKDRGGELCVRALGGRYFCLAPGTDTGFNPFALPPTRENVAAVQQLLRALLRAPAPFTAAEATEMDRAVHGVFELSPEFRRLGSALAFMAPPSGDNLAARLLRWIESDRGVGPLAWVFDNPADTLDLSDGGLVGFDMTHFLDVPEIRTPMMLYLFHRIRQVMDGRRGAVLIDEGWKALDDPMFEDQVGDFYKTARKKNWLIGLITQSPKDSLRTRIAHTITEQAATKICLPSMNPSREDYVDGMGLTQGEFDAVRSLSESSRQFLVKQGQNSVICELDLSEFEDDVAILSGTATNIALAQAIRDEVGDDPAEWIPVFQRERRRQ